MAPLLSKRTRAIIPMHYAGPPADFEPIRELVAGRNITVIEDAAHAFGSIRDGQRVGAGAEFAAFSFAPTKQIASSNGGLLLYRDGERRTEINQLAFLGLAADTYNRTVAQGVSPTQQSRGSATSTRSTTWRRRSPSPASSGSRTSSRSARAGRALLPPARGPRAGRADAAPQQRRDLLVHHADPGAGGQRDGLRAHLAERNIDSTVHYPNLLEQPAFQGCRGDVPVTARETRRVISLPLHQHIEPGEVDRICDTVRSFLG